MKLKMCRVQLNVTKMYVLCCFAYAKNYNRIHKKNNKVNMFLHPSTQLPKVQQKKKTLWHPRSDDNEGVSKSLTTNIIDNQTFY